MFILTRELGGVCSRSRVCTNNCTKVGHVYMCGTTVLGGTLRIHAQMRYFCHTVGVLPGLPVLLSRSHIARCGPGTRSQRRGDLNVKHKRLQEENQCQDILTAHPCQLCIIPDFHPAFTTHAALPKASTSVNAERLPLAYSK